MTNYATLAINRQMNMTNICTILINNHGQLYRQE